MPGGSCYCMTLVTDLPRRSPRFAAPQPAPPSPSPPALEEEESSGDSEENSAMDEDWFGSMIAPAPVVGPQRDAHVRAWRKLYPQHDRHVLAWKWTVRKRPRPPVGHPPPDASGSLDPSALPEPFTSAWPPGEPLESSGCRVCLDSAPSQPTSITSLDPLRLWIPLLLIGCLSCRKNGWILSSSWTCGKRIGEKRLNHCMKPRPPG